MPDPSSATASPLLALTFSANEVSTVRRAVRRYAAQAGLHGDSLRDFVLAVNEIVTVTVMDRGGRGELRLWDNGESVGCEVANSPPGLGSVGEPSPPVHDDRGLRLARLLVDALDIVTSPTGAIVRLHALVPRTRRTPANAG